MEIWRRWPQPVTASGPAVCSVGRLSVDRMLLSDGEVVDIGGGPFGLMADRHLDLAVLHHSLHLTLGADAVFGFYEAYGIDPDLVAARSPRALRPSAGLDADSIRREPATTRDRRSHRHRQVDVGVGGCRSDSSAASIVSADAMAVYRGMNIGTAKPDADRSRPHQTLRDRRGRPVRRVRNGRFPGRSSPTRSALIEAAGEVPILVGGTGLYVRAIVDDFTTPGRYPDVAAELEEHRDTAATPSTSRRGGSGGCARRWSRPTVAASCGLSR